MISFVLMCAFLLNDGTRESALIDAGRALSEEPGIVASEVAPAAGADAAMTVEQEWSAVPIQLRVRVISGRAHYLFPSGGEVQRLRPSSNPIWTDEGIYIELGLASEIELLWNGAGSARIKGPATISWERTAMELTSIDLDQSFNRVALAKAAVLKSIGGRGRAQRHSVSIADLRPGRQFDSAPIHLVLGFLKSAEIEAHGPGMKITVEQNGWNLQAPSGAFRLEGRKDDRLYIAHHGGKPIRVRSERLRAPGKWPVRISSGTRIDLPAPSSPPLSKP